MNLAVVEIISPVAVDYICYYCSLSSHLYLWLYIQRRDADIILKGNNKEVRLHMWNLSLSMVKTFTHFTHQETLQEKATPPNILNLKHMLIHTHQNTKLLFKVK